jgi:hypothetical protein
VTTSVIVDEYFFHFKKKNENFSFWIGKSPIVIKDFLCLHGLWCEKRPLLAFDLISWVCGARKDIKPSLILNTSFQKEKPSVCGWKNSKKKFFNWNFFFLNSPQIRKLLFFPTFALLMRNCIRVRDASNFAWLNQFGENLFLPKIIVFKNALKNELQKPFLVGQKDALINVLCLWVAIDWKLPTNVLKCALPCVVVDLFLNKEHSKKEDRVNIFFLMHLSMLKKGVGFSLFSIEKKRVSKGSLLI